jgi:hypothetical protein
LTPGLPCSTQRTTGAFNALLAKHSFDEAVLCCQKSAVESGLLTEQEFAEVKGAMAPLLHVEARNRVKRVSLCPVSVVVAAFSAYGRCEQTIALLQALEALPRLWQLHMEQERNRAALEEDLVLNDELAEAEAEDPVHLVDELSTMVPFLSDAQDDAVSKSWTLARIPEALEVELAAFVKFRQDALNIHRDGAAVVPVTCENDKGTCLRFLGWLQAERDIQPGLGCFATLEVSQWVSDWVNALREKGLKYSSLANYTNSIISITSFVYNTYKVDDAIHSLPTTPLEELVRLRGQCEKEAKQEKLFARADPNYLEWEEANAARAKAEAAYRSSKRGLRDWLLIALHTIQPPDRVGVIRRLRLGTSLKRCGDGFVLDCTAQRSHKTSKFYGPSVSTVSPMLTEVLNLYLADMEFDVVDDENPYLFHPLKDTTRCVVSSQWTAMVKAAFLKHSGKAVAPKSLRSSFVTYIRDNEAAPEVLKSAANAMHHQLATADSDKYDRRTHDRLNEAAVRFAEQIATKFTPAPCPDGWSPVDVPSVEFVKVDGAFVATFEWFPALRVDTKYCWRVVPGISEFKWKTPPHPGKSLRLAMPNAYKGARFTLSNLLVEDACAPTEVYEQVPDLDEWACVEVELRATRLDGDSYSVPLPDLKPGSEVRIVDPRVVEQTYRLEEKGKEEAYVITVRIPDGEDEIVLTGLEVKEAAVANVRPVSMVKPPVPCEEARASLRALQFTLGTAPRNGDCFPASVLSDAENIIDAVADLRKDAVDLLCADQIGGVPGETVRALEGLPADKDEAEAEMKDWRRNGHWRRDGEENLSAAFMFGVAASTQPTIVIEKRGDAYLDPCSLYAQRVDGALAKTPPVGGNPETIPFVKQLPWADVLTALKVEPRAYRVVQFDKDEMHHSPFLYQKPVKQAQSEPEKPVVQPKSKPVVQPKKKAQPKVQPEAQRVAQPKVQRRSKPAPQKSNPKAQAKVKTKAQVKAQATAQVKATSASRFGRKRKAPTHWGDGAEAGQPASKFRTEAPVSTPYVLEDEMAVPDFCTVGALISCVGFYGGAHALFRARVKAIRKQFPPIVCQYTCDAHGNTNSLALPDPNVAYVHVGMVEAA